MAAYVVAVTGGIASGKSLVDQAFAALGPTVVDADLIAREIVEPGCPALGEIAKRFGHHVLQLDGTLDRKALRRIIFEDAGARRELENITHPRIRELMQARCLCAPGPYVLASIPLLAEGGAINAYRWLSRILVVDSPVAAQRERLMHRDGIDAGLADQMIAAQVNRSDRLRLATDVIVNDAGMDLLPSAVHRLHTLFVSRSGS